MLRRSGIVKLRSLYHSSSKAQLHAARSVFISSPGLHQNSIGRKTANYFPAVLQSDRKTPQQAMRGIRELSTASGDPSPLPATGFSYPGPRKLDEIVKMQLLTKHGTGRVREIWQEYHKDHKSAVGDVLNEEEYGLLMQRTQRCRHFVLPVPREGGYFTLLVQFQGKQCFMTYLEDYKQNAAGAQPYLTITLFDELLETKNIALVRGEVTNMLTRQEAKVLLELVKEFYLGSRRNYDAVVAFNEDGDKFDFKTVLRAAGIA